LPHNQQLGWQSFDCLVKWLVVTSESTQLTEKIAESEPAAGFSVSSVYSVAKRGKEMKTINEPLMLLLTGTHLLALTAINPHDYPTWWMEVAPIFIAVPILVATYKCYTLTPLI
jgi:hypothetical protein